MNSEAASDTSAVEDYLKLLLAFHALPEKNRRQTFMEISGYPHYENVCSNILGFYLNPSAEHGLKDLLLSAFLRMAGQGEIRIPEKALPIREFLAERQQRIDLVIDCETFTLGIENKIYHWDANDFENYGRVIDRLGRNKSVIKALLCLHRTKDQASLPGGFKRFTYAELWQQVRSMLGNYIGRADPKWATCFLDFIETTSNLAGNNMEHTKLDKFFIDNNELLEQIVTQRNAFFGRLNQKVEELKTMINDSVEAKGLSDPAWIWQKSCLVLEFKFKEVYDISFDLFLGPKGWELQLFGRKAKSSNYLARLIEQPGLNAQVANSLIVNNRYIVQTWPIDADLGEITNALRTWMRALLEADAKEAI